MKILKALLFLIPFLSCQDKRDKLHNQKNLHLRDESHITLYRSTEESFRKDFFLRIANDKATLYGWEILNNNDTIYFRSKSIVEKDTSGLITIRLDNYDFSRIKLDPKNLDFITVGTDLIHPNFVCHSTFFNGKTFGDTIQFLAVKNIYDSRADTFKFEKIK